ncbi:MAG TPA: amidohydrolase family protein [Novosphingobium sp.]|nr:amidohydrolase family protein [Novosphingobium sp.]
MDIVDSQVHLFLTMDDDAAVHAMDALGIHGMLIDEAWDFGEDGPPQSAMPSYRLPTGQYRPVSPGGRTASMRRPDRFSYLVRVNPEDPDLDFVMAEMAASPGCRAYRFDSRGDEDAIGSGARMAFFKTAEKHGLAMFIGTPGRAALFEQYIRACPSLPVVFDHCGVPLKPEDFDDLLRLAAYPNVHMKWCHAPTLFGGTAFPFPEVRPVLQRALDAFGRERIMWGSDFNAVPLLQGMFGGPLYTWAEALFSTLDNPDLSADDKEWLLGRCARKVLGWERA